MDWIADHKAVIMEVNMKMKKGIVNKEREIWSYDRADIGGFRTFLKQNYDGWVREGGLVEQGWKNFRRLLEQGMRTFIPRRKVRKSTDPLFYNRMVKQLKRKCRKESETFRKGKGD